LPKLASAGAAGVEYAFETIRLAGFDPRPGDGDLASLPTRLDKLFDQSTPLPSPSEEAKEEREVSAAIIYLYVDSLSDIGARPLPAF
jgi:hypothetical protein